MKCSNVGIPLLLFVGPFLLACSERAQAEASEVANEIGESWDAVKSYTIERSSEFRDSVNGGLRDLDRELEELSDRSGEAWDATTAELASKRKALAAQLEELGDATADAWTVSRDKTVALYEEYRDAVRRAFNQPQD